MSVALTVAQRNARAAVCTRKWFGGHLVAFSGIDGETSFDSGLVLRTGFRGTHLDVVLPCTGRVSFDETAPERCFLGSDWAVLHIGGSEVALAMADAHNIIVDGRCRVVPGDRLRVHRAGNRTVISVAGYERPELAEAPMASVQAERQKWTNTVVPRRAALTSVQNAAVEKAVCQIKSMVHFPEGKIRHAWSTPDRWPHRRMWLWDSAFHAIGMRHLDPGLARDFISAVFDCQEPSGAIPHMMAPRTVSDITQPPVLGLGIANVLEVQRDAPWLERLYEPLGTFLTWIETNRDRDGDGLVEWHIEADEHCRSGESGMDNSVRFDSARPVGAVDFNAYLSLEFLLMSRFARELGRTADAAMWLSKHEERNQTINALCWDEENGFYYDYDASRRARSPVESVAGFLPLVCGAAEGARAQRLRRALLDQNRFGTAFPIPSVSARDPAHTDDMWRGPTWINMNWLICRGLITVGFPDDAEELRRRTCAEVERHVERYGTFFEYYDSHRRKDPPDLKRKGKNAPDESPYHQVFFDYGWSAALYLDMVLASGDTWTVQKRGDDR